VVRRLLSIKWGKVGEGFQKDVLLKLNITVGQANIYKKKCIYIIRNLPWIIVYLDEIKR